MDVKSLSGILGHSNISITLSIYVHSSYEIKKNLLTDYKNKNRNEITHFCSYNYGPTATTLL